MSSSCLLRRRRPRPHSFLAVIIFHVCPLRQPTSLSHAVTVADDAPFTRYDRDAYLVARYGDGDEESYESAYERAREEAESKTRNEQRQTTTQHSYDDPIGCATYLAPSSIPNSGLGMYTAVPYKKGEAFPLPEVGILIQEMNRHYVPEPGKPAKLLAQYPWAAQTLTFGGHEVGYGESIVPGLGMLANSHLGLVNMRHSELWKTQPRLDGTDSYHGTDGLTKENDPGRGAHTPHGRVMFEAQEAIQAGEELFVSYGDKWFEGREHLLGIVPGGEHFKEADKLLSEFDNKDGHAGGKEDYEMFLKGAYEKDKRLRAALPDNLEDVPAALRTGTARFSVPNSIRPTSWLEEEGACLDNIVSGKSTIPQAGGGAFATRSIQKGSRITTTPVITLERAELRLWEKREAFEDGSARMELAGHQLLGNYCYGSEESSLLFFPYSPTVNFINHGGKEKSNAEVRWSTVPHHKSEWLSEDKMTRTTLQEMKDKLKTGMMFDIVAKRDIRRGEEVLLDYGEDWEGAWNRHVEEWPSMLNVTEDDGKWRQPHLNITERLSLPTAADLNRIDLHPIIRTLQEQDGESYPSYVMTRCRYEPPDECVPFGNHCRSRWKLTFDAMQVHPCTVLSRTNLGDTDWYTVQVEVPDKERKGGKVLHLVEYVTRDGIVFVDRPYHKDQYARDVFRHVIGLPNGMMPTHWMDIEKYGSSSSNISTDEGFTAESDEGGGE